MRLLHTRVIFMLGPEANHFVTVAHPENFHWRESSFGDLIPLLGDGLLTVDDEFHDRARAIMLPAFHREQMTASMTAMEAETESSMAALAPGDAVDVYDWMRNLAMRIAMRALLGLDPDEAGRAPPRPSTSSARSAITGSTTACGCCADRDRPGAS